MSDIQFLAAFVASLTFLQILIGSSPTYTTMVGFIGLGIEATLPIPQFLSNYRQSSVAGFRPSVIIAWLIGDMFKVSYFFFGNANVSWQFKACAIVQFSFDLGIAIQFCLYGNREAWNADVSMVKHIEEELEEGMHTLRREIDKL